MRKGERIGIRPLNDYFYNQQPGTSLSEELPLEHKMYCFKTFQKAWRVSHYSPSQSKISDFVDTVSLSLLHLQVDN